MRSLPNKFHYREIKQDEILDSTYLVRVRSKNWNKHRGILTLKKGTSFCYYYSPINNYYGLNLLDESGNLKHKWLSPEEVYSTFLVSKPSNIDAILYEGLAYNIID